MVQICEQFLQINHISRVWSRVDKKTSPTWQQLDDICNGEANDTRQSHLHPINLCYIQAYILRITISASIQTLQVHYFLDAFNQHLITVRANKYYEHHLFQISWLTIPPWITVYVTLRIMTSVVFYCETKIWIVVQHCCKNNMVNVIWIHHQVGELNPAFTGFILNCEIMWCYHLRYKPAEEMAATGEGLHSSRFCYDKIGKLKYIISIIEQ